jgi:hypothetical protein
MVIDSVICLSMPTFFVLPYHSVRHIFSCFCGQPTRDRTGDNSNTMSPCVCHDSFVGRVGLLISCLVQRPPPSETISGHARANIVNTNQRERGGLKLLLFIHFTTKKSTLFDIEFLYSIISVIDDIEIAVSIK